MPPASPKQRPRLITFQYLVKTHHGRAYFLWGSFLAMVVSSSFGIRTLVHPRLPLPVIEPLLSHKSQQTAALFSQQPKMQVTEEENAENTEINKVILLLFVYALIISSSLFGVSLFIHALLQLQRKSQRSTKPFPGSPQDQ